jgi:hypothetical protein
MSISRADYFKDLLADCEIAVAQYPSEDKPLIILALILSDSINGIRKGMLQQGISRTSFTDKF